MRRRGTGPSAGALLLLYMTVALLTSSITPKAAAAVPSQVAATDADTAGTDPFATPPPQHRRHRRPHKHAVSVTPASFAATVEPPSATDAAFLAWATRSSSSSDGSSGGGGLVAAVTLGTKGGVRGTFATRNLRPGDVIAKIPMKSAMWFPTNYTNIRDLSVSLLREAADPLSPKAPWLAALTTLKRNSSRQNTSFSSPPPQPLRLQLHAETFPVEYLHLLGSRAQARRIATIQHDTAMYWAARGLALTKEGITLEDLRAATVTILTRYMSLRHRGVDYTVMIPLLDMANHDESCSNWYEFRPCSTVIPPGPRLNWDLEAIATEADSVEKSDLCCFWITAAGLEEGQEVCNSYGYLPPDVALLQYGFLPANSAVPLAATDSHNAPSNWEEDGGGHSRGEAPKPFDGNLPALRAELSRVTRLATALDASHSAAAATPPAASDPSGAVLRDLLTLRRARVDALRSEAKRLRARVREEVARAREAAAAFDANGGLTSPAAVSYAEL